MTAEEIWQAAYFKNYGTNMDNHVSDWEIEAMKDYARQKCEEQRKICLRAYDNFYAGSEEDFAPQPLVDAILNAPEPNFD
jgi:hypothetical protein